MHSACGFFLLSDEIINCNYDLLSRNNDNKSLTLCSGLGNAMLFRSFMINMYLKISVTMDFNRVDFFPKECLCVVK